MIRIKRARDQIEADDADNSTGLSSLEGDLKKVRISYTPGQLRLLKDIEEAKQKFQLKVLQGESPSTCVLHLILSDGREVRFQMTVPRYYPHNAPVVRCLDFYHILPFLDNNGIVVHRGLNEDWNAICSIDNVIQILQVVCQSIQESLQYCTS